MDSIVANVYQTSDVDKFIQNEINRNINKKHVKSIANNIMSMGEIIIPIIVDENYKIIDGHHRINAVKYLNEKNYSVQIPYIIKSNKNSIQQLTTVNSINKSYTMKDFIDLYSKAKDGQCRKLVEISEKLNESPTTLLTVISCGSDVKRNKEKIKNDEFIDFDDWDLLDKYYEFLNKICDFLHLTTKTKQMLFRIYQVKNFNEDIFVRNVKNKYIQINSKIRCSTSQKVCKEQLLELYNKRNNKYKINYHFDADGKIKIDD